MSVLKQRNALAAVLIAVGVAVLSVFLMYIGTVGTEWWNVLLLQVGLALLIAAVFSGLWEWHGKRMLAQEIYELAGVGVDIQRWGIRRTSLDWREIQWSELIGASSNIDLLFSWARTWRGQNFPALKRFCANPANTLRVCLPDPSQDWLMASLSHRYGRSPSEVAADIREAARYFQELQQPGGAAISVFYRNGEPLYSMHRFDSAAVLAIYPHRPIRDEAPTLHVGAGDLYSFLRDDFESAIKGAIEARDVPDAVAG